MELYNSKYLLEAGMRYGSGRDLSDIQAATPASQLHNLIIIFLAQTLLKRNKIGTRSHCT